MRILSHRGYWRTDAEKNTETAFLRSFQLGFGTETDIRDWNGQLVISHDPPTGNPLPARRFFELYKQHGDGLTLALNIKADGLQEPLRALLTEFAIGDYFVFDMSIPDTLAYLSREMVVFTRQSEYEPVPAFYGTADGIWMDCFESDWATPDSIEEHLHANKRVALVSPDLHKRPYRAFWDRLAAIRGREGLMLCTDHPQEAQAIFAAN